MKIIRLCRNDFDTLYDILTEYLNTKISADECIAQAVKYVKENKLLLKPFEDIPFGEGYRLIHEYYEYDGCRSIYFSPHEKKLFYEGIISMRHINEMKYVDYLSFDREDIKMICKKYRLKPIDNEESN
jgi:hypothetical protein